jgi:hypothetical protein
MLFVVFVRPDWGLLVFDWDWRNEDEARDGFPEGWRDDFTRVLWQKT